MPNSATAAAPTARRVKSPVSPDDVVAAIASAAFLRTPGRKNGGRLSGEGLGTPAREEPVAVAFRLFSNWDDRKPACDFRFSLRSCGNSLSLPRQWADPLSVPERVHSWARQGVGSGFRMQGVQLDGRYAL